MVKIVLAVQMYLRSVSRAMREEDSGQGVLEYVGMVGVAALLVVAVLQATDAVDLGQFFTDRINEVKDFF